MRPKSFVAILEYCGHCRPGWPPGHRLCCLSTGSIIDAEAEGALAPSKGQGSQRRQCSKYVELGIMHAHVLHLSPDMRLLWSSRRCCSDEHYPATALAALQVSPENAFCHSHAVYKQAAGGAGELVQSMQVLYICVGVSHSHPHMCCRRSRGSSQDVSARRSQQCPVTSHAQRATMSGRGVHQVQSPVLMVFSLTDWPCYMGLRSSPLQPNMAPASTGCWESLILPLAPMAGPCTFLPGA